MTWWLVLSCKVNENTNNSPRELPTVSVRDSAQSSTAVMTELNDDDLFNCCLSFSHRSLNVIVINGTNRLNVVSQILQQTLLDLARKLDVDLDLRKCVV